MPGPYRVRRQAISTRLAEGLALDVPDRPRRSQRSPNSAILYLRSSGQCPIEHMPNPLVSERIEAIDLRSRTPLICAAIAARPHAERRRGPSSPVSVSTSTKHTGAEFCRLTVEPAEIADHAQRRGGDAGDLASSGLGSTRRSPVVLFRGSGSASVSERNPPRLSIVVPCCDFAGGLHGAGCRQFALRGKTTSPPSACASCTGRMSGVLTEKFGRKYSRSG